MTRRRLLVGLLLTSAVLAGFAGWLWITDACQLTLAKLHRVKKGMSRAEVIRVVGRPPGDYSSGEYSLSDYEREYFESTWLCDEAALMVRFDGDNAIEVEVREVDDRPTLTERVRRWLGL